jgi:hypothetical protein
VNPHYPLVPPPVQAREIPNLQQQFLDERHIQTSAWPHSHFAAARLHQIGGPNQVRDRCYDFKNIFAEKFGEKIGVFDSKQS